MGTSIALNAARRTDALKAPVVLLERGTIGSGASGRSGAILRQIYSDRQLVVMARDSLREYASFENKTGRSIGFQRTGVLTLAGAKQEDWAARIEQNVAMMAELGVDARVVRAPEIRELVPGIRVQNGSVGVWEAQAGFVDPEMTVEAFASLARTYGAATRVGVKLEAVNVENGRVVGAETSEGHYDVEQVVIVAGAWSRAIFRDLGVDVPMKIVRPENHYVSMPFSELESEDERDAGGPALGFDISEDANTGLRDSMAPRGLHPVVIDLERSAYHRCEPDTRRTRVGRTDYDNDPILEDPDVFDEEVSEELAGWARESLISRLPDYEDQPDAGSVCGWYALTPDAQPVIGPVEGIEGLFVATGFSGHGFKLAPSVGEGMAQMLFDEPVSAFDDEFFQPGRFRGEVQWTGRFGL